MCTHVTVGESVCGGELMHSGELLVSSSWSDESISKATQAALNDLFLEYKD